MWFQDLKYQKSLEVTMIHSIIQENLRGLQKIGDSNIYQAVQNIQYQMDWQKRQYKQQKYF